MNTALLLLQSKGLESTIKGNNIVNSNYAKHLCSIKNHGLFKHKIVFKALNMPIKIDYRIIINQISDFRINLN